MGAGTSAEEFFLKSINVESIFEFVERIHQGLLQYTERRGLAKQTSLIFYLIILLVLPTIVLYSWMTGVINSKKSIKRLKIDRDISSLTKKWT